MVLPIVLGQQLFSDPLKFLGSLNREEDCRNLH